MSESGRESRRGVFVAAGTAIGLLVLSGMCYRVAAEYLARPSESIPLPAGALARLPMRIGQWVGRDVPLSEAVIEATDSDDHVSRAYSRGYGAERIWVFIAYGVRARDLMPHRPEVCYPGSGWTLEGRRDADLTLGDGSKLRCRTLRFSRGGLTATQRTVLNYYIVDGQYCADVSVLRSKAWRGSSGVRYMAQVQITCAGGALAPDSAARSVSAFAVDSAEAIRALLPDTGAAPDAAGG